jgi:hypothetical protein
MDFSEKVLVEGPGISAAEP